MLGSFTQGASFNPNSPPSEVRSAETPSQKRNQAEGVVRCSSHSQKVLSRDSRAAASKAWTCCFFLTRSLMMTKRSSRTAEGSYSSCCHKELLCLGGTSKLFESVRQHLSPIHGTLPALFKCMGLESLIQMPPEIYSAL